MKNLTWQNPGQLFVAQELIKIVKLKCCGIKGSFKLSVYQDGQSPYPFAKFYTTEGTIWEYSQFPFIIGPWIDIFPIDEGDVDDEKANRALERFHYSMWKYRKSIAYASWKDIFKDFTHLNLLDGLMKLFKKIRYVPFKKYYINEIDNRLNEIRSIKGKTLRCYSTALTNEIFDKSWFEKAISVPFEDTTILVPNGYHEFLTALYGDYMQLPPVEKRVNHPGYFIDLKHTLTREEILKEHRDLLKENSSMSLKVVIDEIKHRAKGWQRPRPKKKE